jgi:hypothetical protein
LGEREKKCNYFDALINQHGIKGGHPFSGRRHLKRRGTGVRGTRFFRAKAGRTTIPGALDLDDFLESLGTVDLGRGKGRTRRLALSFSPNVMYEIFL